MQQETSTEPASNARGVVKELKDQVGDQARGLAEQAQGAAEAGKERLIEGAAGVAQALRHASEGMRADDQESVGEYTDALATKVDEVARFLESRDLPTMAREVSEFARRQPALFLGGAFTLGMVAARFLKSSSDHRATGPDETASSHLGSSAEQQPPDPSISSPGGVPPLPSASGDGL